MNLEEQIYLRKSCRKYSEDEIDMNLIHEFLSAAEQLNDEIEYSYEILTRDMVNVRTRWSAPYYLAIYSEKRDNYLENVGFVFQQLSLYLQSLGIGSCWVAMASPKSKRPDFIITIAFGKSDDISRDIAQFKRKSLSDITDFEDEKLVPAQLAPSAINSQPWYFKHADDGFDVYQVRPNILKRHVLKKWNPIDMGIALAHLYVVNPDSFQFQRKSDFENIKGHTYTGSVKL